MLSMKARPKISFHTGSALEIAQWGRKEIKPIKVTSKNYDNYLENYHKKIKAFSKIRTGFTFKSGHEDEFIYETGKDYIRVCFDSEVTKSLLHVCFQDQNICRNHHRTCQEHINRAFGAFTNNHPEKLLKEIERLMKRLGLTKNVDGKQ